MKSLTKMVKAEVGKRLKAARIEAGYSPTEFAQAMDTDLSTVYRWEAGSLPKGPALERILTLVKKDLAYLIGPAPMPPTVQELLNTVATQENQIQQLQRRVRILESKGPTIREASSWSAADSAWSTRSRIPGPIRELLEQISPDNADAWDIIKTAALTVGKAKPPVKSRT